MPSFECDENHKHYKITLCNLDNFSKKKQSLLFDHSVLLLTNPNKWDFVLNATS